MYINQQSIWIYVHTLISVVITWTGTSSNVNWSMSEIYLAISATLVCKRQLPMGTNLGRFLRCAAPVSLEQQMRISCRVPPWTNPSAPPLKTFSPAQSAPVDLHPSATSVRPRKSDRHSSNQPETRPHSDPTLCWDTSYGSWGDNLKSSHPTLKSAECHINCLFTLAN